MFARLLTEHARARLGRSRVEVAEIAVWPAQASSPTLGREMAYWAALEAASSATMRTFARDELQTLLGSWAAHGSPYLARLDLSLLRKGLVGAGQSGAGRPAFIAIRPDATVTARDAQTLVIATDDALRRLEGQDRVALKRQVPLLESDQPIAVKLHWNGLAVCS